MKRFLFLLFLFITSFSTAQVTIIDMPVNSQQRFSGCSYALFNDSGSAGANYSNGENGQIIFCPTIPTDRMQIDFRQMDIGAGDVLTIYDGDNASFPVLATVSNTTTALGLIQASPSNPDGCLYITFTSDNNDTNNFGWRAERGCFDPCQSISTVMVTTPAYDPTDNILRICQGDTVTFDGSANFSVDGAGATYEWDLGNGNGLNPGQIQTETYNTTGIYQVQFVVTDNLGCKDRQEVDLTVFVSTDPDFTGTQAADTSICFGESTDITGVVNPVNFAISPSPPITGRTFLPDGSGVSYTTCINVDLFPIGATFNNASDLLNAFIEIEHSFMGDLEIKLISPTGATVTFLFYPNSGGGRFLGNALDDGTTNPGAGFMYTFTEASTATQTLDQATAGVGVNTPIPAGDYLPEDPFSNFIGSPLNGSWCIEITDNLNVDNGYIFQWGLNFNPAIIPGDLSFTPGVVSEQWITDPSITATNGNVITVTPTVAGQNCYDYEFVDSFGCTYTEQVCIDVLAEIPSAAPEDIILCNTSSVTTVDLTQNDSVILNGLPAADYVVTYHTSLTDAENGVGAINNPTAYPINMPPMTIFSAIRYTTTNCIVVDSFVVDVIDFSSFVIPDFEQCGPITNFDLEAYVLTALSGGGSGGSNFTITYYDSLMDAQNETNPIVNPTAFDLAVGTVTIYVRIVSTTDTSCSSINPFSLTAAPIPVANTPMDMVTCDDLSNDGTEVFVLSDQNAAILNGQTATVTYHLTQLDAVNGVAPLNAAAYANTASPQTIYARVTDNTTLMCSNTTSFDLEVNRRAVFIGANDLVVCDDVSNDGFEIFDLTSQNSSVLGTQLAADNTISFYNSLADADAGINAIVNPTAYTNTTVGMQTVHVRIENSTTTDCYDTGSFDLIINAIPVANPVAEVIVCDDPSNDEQDVFTFSNYSSQVLLAQDPMLYAVSYHDSQANADARTNPLDTTSYTNTSNPQTIYVRIENVNNTSCANTTTFDLTINESPAIATAPDLTLCDDPSGDGVESFDLTQNDAIILNGLNPSDYTIVYSNATGVITSPYSNTSSPETINVSVENNTTNCTDTTSFDLIVSPVPATVPSFTIEECDEDGDGVASFTLGDENARIINGQTGTSVSYYDSPADALSGSNPLDTASYDNTIAPQTIYYRLEFTNSGCFSIGDFVIEPVDAPIAVTPTALEACDDGSGNATVDVSLADAQVTTGQAGSTVVYYLNQTDADSQVNGITNDFTYSSNTTLIVRVDDDNTECFSFTTLDLIFNTLPTPSLLDQYILCLDENNNLVNGPVSLDTGLNDTEYSFEWTLNGALIPASTASIDVAEGGDYEVTATRIATGCSNSITTNVRVSSVPEVYDIDITTDPFDKDHQVIVRAQGPDQYWYRLDDGPYVNNGTFNDVTAGAHTVTIAERSGCGEIVVDIFVFGYPDYFTPNADGIHDTWNIIGGDRLPGTTLYIFDRYGKLIKQLDVDGSGWDGTYNGQPMPSSDYWFKIEYAFDGQQREASGHFAMKR